MQRHGVHTDGVRRRGCRLFGPPSYHVRTLGSENRGGSFLTATFETVRTRLLLRERARRGTPGGSAEASASHQVPAEVEAAVEAVDGLLQLQLEHQAVLV